MELERLGLSATRLAHFAQELRDVSVAQIVKGKNEIEFRIDTGSSLNGDSYKGIMYVLFTPKRIHKSNLDDYRAVAEDRNKDGDIVLYRHIKGNWYVYLFVNS
jgi:hypothetical protein